MTADRKPRPQAQSQSDVAEDPRLLSMSEVSTLALRGEARRISVAFVIACCVNLDREKSDWSRWRWGTQ
ncbi:hypothetical protein J19TS2_49290 [Cohnella xylanilytica]|nr:hypothetical protein J19TS2_49290 [Cohnella xylanilytica]